MKKLSKVQVRKLEELVDAVQAAMDQLTQAVTDFNDAREDEWHAAQAKWAAVGKASDDVAEALKAKATQILDRYNDAQPGFDIVIDAYAVLCGTLVPLRDFRDEVCTDMRAYFDDKSDRWQESSAGSSYGDWIGQWEDVDLEDPAPFVFVALKDEETYLKGILDSFVEDRFNLDDMTEAPAA